MEPHMEYIGNDHRQIIQPPTVESFWRDRMYRNTSELHRKRPQADNSTTSRMYANTLEITGTDRRGIIQPPTAEPLWRGRTYGNT